MGIKVSNVCVVDSLCERLRGCHSLLVEALLLQKLQLLLVGIEVGEHLEDVGKSGDFLLEMRVGDEEVGQLIHLSFIDGHKEPPRTDTSLQTFQPLRRRQTATDVPVLMGLWRRRLFDTRLRRLYFDFLLRFYCCQCLNAEEIPLRRGY